jgi:hypothetical protein
VEGFKEFTGNIFSHLRFLLMLFESDYRFNFKEKIKCISDGIKPGEFSFHGKSFETSKTSPTSMAFLCCKKFKFALLIPRQSFENVEKFQEAFSCSITFKLFPLH